MEKPTRSPFFKITTLIIPAVCLFLTAAGHADEVQLKEDRPDRYTVKKGDTLWDISSRFLKSPWLWARVWKINDQIKNPHLIYPGDVIALRYVDGKPELVLLRNEKVPMSEASPGEAAPVEQKPDAAPELPPLHEGSTGRTEKLSPLVHIEPLGGAVPTIPPNAIAPFLAYPLAIEEKDLDRAGYVTHGLDDRIALGNGSEFYARDVKDDEEFFAVFRRGRAMRDPDTNELLAYEAVHLGDAKKLEGGDPSKFVVTRVKQEIQPTDRLLATPPFVALPHYYPSASKKKLHGHILGALNAVAEIGPYGIVAITLGKREGVQEGNVFRVMRHVGKRRDPLTRNDYKLPDEESALIMVFRVYEKVSYALVMNATRPVHVLDAVETPN